MIRSGWVRRIIGRAAGRESVDEVLDDLVERQAEVARRRGPLRARLWTLRQIGAWALQGWRLGLPREGRGFLPAARDVRSAVRRVRRAPTHAAAVVATLGLGIGGVTAAFAVVDGVLLRPLPLERPDELFAVRGDRNGQSWWATSALELQAWRDDARLLTGLAWSQSGSGVLDVDGEPTYVRTARVSPGFFSVLGAPPALGREFGPGADAAPAAAEVVLTHRLWSTRFGGDPGVVGRSVVLDDQAHTVVGIARADAPMDFLAPHDLYVVRAFQPGAFSEQGRVNQAVVRVRPPATRETVASELRAVMGARGLPSFEGGWMPRLTPLAEEIVGEARPVLLLVLASVVCVLLVACLNVSGLVVARAQGRAREARLRRALGSGRRDLLVQAAAEAMVLAGLGAGVGLALGVWGAQALVSGWPDLLPRAVDVATGRVVGFAAGLAVVGGGLLAAVSGAALVAVSGGSLGGSRSTGPGRREGRAGALLVGAEIAVALVLLVGAAATVRSLGALQAVDPGFNLAGPWALDLALSAGRYPDLEAQNRALEALREELEGMPGVEAVGGITNVPLRGPGFTGWHILASRPTPAPGEEPTGGVEMAGPGYFEAMGIPLVEGRAFDRLEALEGRAVAVVDEAMAAVYWPDRSPVGDAVRFGPEGSPSFEIVGVVGAVRYELDERPRPRFYVPERRTFGALPVRTTIVRSSLPPEQVLPAVRAVVARVLPDAPVVGLDPLDELARGSLDVPRLQAALLLVFGVTGLGLGAVGVYGVVHHQVRRRTREVGVRLALGATGPAVVRQIVVRVLGPVGAGVTVGAAATWMLADLVEGVVYGVSARDPVVLAVLSVVLVAVAGWAAWLPARRAASLDPGITLEAP